MKYLTNLKNKYKKFDNWRISRKVRKKYARKMEYDRHLELLNEKWIIKRISDGQIKRREELLEKQARIREMDMLIKFLKKDL